MKKIILPEPFASMVIIGALDFIPNEWEDIKIGEKIFIYAKGTHKDFQNEFKVLNIYHRKVYNEMFFGNLPNVLDEEGKFIGYVQVKEKKTGNIEWSEFSNSILEVHNNFKFKYPVYNYNADFTSLETVSGNKVKLKRMRVDRKKLIVPVGIEEWQQLNANIGCANLSIPYEEYMDKIFPTFNIFGDYDEDDEITEIYFERNGKKVKYESSGVSKSFISKKEWNGNLFFTLNFHLESQDFGTYVVPTNTDNFDPEEYKQNKKLEKLQEKEEEENWSPFYPGEATVKSVKTISIPLGGMTNWKRK